MSPRPLTRLLLPSTFPLPGLTVHLGFRLSQAPAAAAVIAAVAAVTTSESPCLDRRGFLPQSLCWFVYGGSVWQDRRL